jgi:hypothetical protein
VKAIWPTSIGGKLADFPHQAFTDTFEWHIPGHGFGRLRASLNTDSEGIDTQRE